MFVRNPITAVTRSGIRTTASLAGFSAPVSSQVYTANQYNYFMTGLLPATPDQSDSSSIANFYRDIYLHDNVGGSCVDIQSSFPFSDWELRGTDDEKLKVYNHALDRLNLRELIPQISLAYLVDGFYAGSLIFDAEARNFMDILTHDALQCNVLQSPFNNMDPRVRVQVSGATSQFLSSNTDHAAQYISSMPQRFVELLRLGSFDLEPLTTLFIARRGLTDRAYQSYLHRLLPAYLIEKTMYRGTLSEAQRRQRAMTHITSGDDQWTPSAEELRILTEQFQNAERDPMGGWISTRNAVQVSDLRPGGEFWKWTDMSDTLTAYKLRALGISEALLSGDASFAASESAYSIFLETTDAYRNHLTSSIFYKKIFPLIAVANDFYIDKTSKSRSETEMVNYLYNSNNRANLDMPVLHWHKNLSGKSEDNLMEMLEKVSEKGVNIPIKMWLAAAGIDKDTLVRDYQQDPQLRRDLHMDGGQEHVDDVEDAEEDVTSASLNGPFHAGPHPQNIMDRAWGESFEIGKTGKQRHVVQSQARVRDENHRIAKIAIQHRDKNHAAATRNTNLSKLGRAVL